MRFETSERSDIWEIQILRDQKSERPDVWKIRHVTYTSERFERFERSEIMDLGDLRLEIKTDNCEDT